jgi:AcrR family transcriptional regulator
MPRKRQEEVNEATRQAIKATARELMAEKGTAGLSLRGIARKLGMTAPALYHYFGSLEDLITALIVDAFTGHAVAVRQARDAAAEKGQSYGEQIVAGALAYRQWALDNSTDFQLIYGNPIPGYTAPGEVTIPAAHSMGEVFMETVMAAVRSGELRAPDWLQEIPSPIYAHYLDTQGMDKDTAPMFHIMNYIWSMMHGLISLEIYNHSGPVVGDTDAFYDQAKNHNLDSVGLKLG